VLEHKESLGKGMLVELATSVRLRQQHLVLVAAEAQEQ
jgi:hypothetical protein